MPTRRTFRKSRLVWVDANIDEKNADTRETLERFKSVIDDVMPFRRIEQCVQFLQRNHEDKIFVVSSGSLGLQLVQQINEMVQVDSIYIFCGDRARHQSWASSWSKIKIADTDIGSICEAIKQANAYSNLDSSSVDNDQDEIEVDRNQLDPAYMYIKLFKQIFLEMHDEPNERQAFVQHCRSLYQDNERELSNIEQFYREYEPDRAISWYTRDSFMYKTLDRVFRLPQYDLMVDMGFFIRDFHRQLELLHSKQFNGNYDRTFNVFRSRLLSREDFVKLKNRVGGLISFNNFLSTTREKQVAMCFVKHFDKHPDRVPVLFTITVNPFGRSKSYADISSFSDFPEEKEFVFSTNTVFSINHIDESENDEQIAHIQLNLTDEEDRELRMVTDVIEMDLRGKHPYDQMGRLLIQIGQTNKAKELYEKLLQQQPSKQEQADSYHHLGLIQADQSDYREAIKYYERAVSINENMRSRGSPLAMSYEKLGVAYMKMAEYTKALEFFNKALVLFQKLSDGMTPFEALCYNNIGEVYLNLKNESKALEYCHKGLSMRQKSVPAMHPDLGQSYETLGHIYQELKNYNKARSCYQKARGIYQRVLPAGHDRITNLMKSIEAMRSI